MQTKAKEIEKRIMTVKDLKTCLDRLPDDLTVFATNTNGDLSSNVILRLTLQELEIVGK